MLFRLSTFRAVVKDVPMDAKYEDEVSNLKIRKIFFEFVGKHLRNLFKRIFYTYFLRDVSIASLELISGTALLVFGLIFGISHWIASAAHDASTPVGTIMLSATSLIAGLQLVLAFLGYDIGSVPKDPIHGPPAMLDCPQRDVDKDN